MSAVLTQPPTSLPDKTRVTVSYEPEKVLSLGCQERHCNSHACKLQIRDNGDVVYTHRDRHNNEWHWNSRSLREVIETLAVHDLEALRKLVGTDLIRKLAGTST